VANPPIIFLSNVARDVAKLAMDLWALPKMVVNCPIADSTLPKLAVNVMPIPWSNPLPPGYFGHVFSMFLRCFVLPVYLLTDHIHPVAGRPGQNLTPWLMERLHYELYSFIELR
jgi:hypothetical protein